MSLEKNYFKLSNLQLFAEGGGDPNPQEPQEPEVQPKDTVSKEMYDKAAKEIARLKKELKSKQSDDERIAEEQRLKDEELESLRNDKKKSTIVNGLLKQGIKDEDSNAIANAILKGDVDEITKTISLMHKNSTTELQKQIDELKITGIDKPHGGNGGDKEFTLEDFLKMTVDERIELKNSNRELFDTLNKQYKIDRRK